MDDREASVTSSTDFYESDRKPDSPARDGKNGASPIPSMKRKAEELESTQDKKRKLGLPTSASDPSSPNLTPCAGLSPAIWQHIFLSCSLHDLGRLLQVNRSFHSYLTDVRHASTAKPDYGFVRLLKSESVWASARNMHATKPPRPLPGFSELQMCQLSWNKTCQFCDKHSTFTPGEKIWQKGPGVTGVRIVWPFGVRACGSCLLIKSQTDSNLLFSTVSVARPALPFAFVTSDQNYIPAYTLQAATTPANVEIIKYYYKEHVSEIKNELEEALSLGTAAAEEWSKGLESRGKERMKVAENWERWEVKYRWWKDHREPKQHPASVQALNQRPPTTSPTLKAPSPILHAPVPAPPSKYRSIHLGSVDEYRLLAFNGGHAPVSNLTSAAAPPQFTTPSQQYAQYRPPTIPPQPFTPQSAANAVAPPPRSERNLHDANEAKANRKLEIERRCQHMNPPIPPNVLRHMESFKAAIQISQPMNDYAWSMLEPRLQAQLPIAQQAENDHASRVASLTTRAADRRQQDASLKEVKEVLDREWEESQRPVRDKLSLLADDFINQDWDHGRAVTYENSPKFAVDLIMYVRRKFYAEFASDDSASPETQEDVPSPGEPGTSRPKLVLENMKWVYDNKLKPLTEQFRKELFLCYGNGCETNTRFYGFEGVIQHFGAKHTNTFSVGNVVVAWREAEWPEETPFHPDPISVKHAFHPSGSVAQTNNHGSYYGGYSRAGTATPHVQTHIPNPSPGPYQYGNQYNGPFAPPQAQSGYEYSQSYAAPMDVYSSYQSMGPPNYGYPGQNGYATSPAMSHPAMATQPASKPRLQANRNSEDVEHRTSLFDKQVSTIIEAAQDVWKQTSGIKELPNSLRIYVLLQRVISKFHIEFDHEPTLNHFVDALSNHQISKALKNAPGLSCKSCQKETMYRVSQGYSSRSEERKTYTVLNLFMHFQSQHSNSYNQDFGHVHQSALDLDWREDMIELPSNRIISGLIHAPGMDDDKLLMIATVFPTLFPTPLPKIGTIDSTGTASPAHSTSKDSRDATGTGGTPGVILEKSGPSSLASPYTGSPRPPKPTEDEYDPQHPALSTPASHIGRLTTRRRQSSPHLDHRRRYYAEPQYYVGDKRRSAERTNGANGFLSQLSHAQVDDDYPGPREYIEVASNSSRIRDAGPVYEEFPGRRPIYRESEDLYEPGPHGVIYAAPRDRPTSRGYGSYPYRQVSYADEEGRRPEYRLVREHQRSSPTGSRAAADRFLEDLGDSLSANRNLAQESGLPTNSNLPTADLEPDDGSRYTPPPPNLSHANDQPNQGRTQPITHPTAPSTVSNGSRYDEPRPGGRQIPTPDPAAGPRRVGPPRRRERHQDHAPSRYARYMSVARDEPYARGPSVGRAHSRRYERYEEQRRRIDQQETPQPNAERDYEAEFSRDRSADPGPLSDYQAPARHGPRDYVPLQDRAHPYSPPRRRYLGPADDTRGAPPVYIDEFGQPIEEYEIVRVPRDYRSARGPYVAQSARYYPEHETDRVQYVSYDRPPPQRYERAPPGYVYYEERPVQARRPAFEPDNETSYEPPPPEIKVEGTPAGAEGS